MDRKEEGGKEIMTITDDILQTIERLLKQTEEEKEKWKIEAENQHIDSTVNYRTIATLIQIERTFLMLKYLAIITERLALTIERLPNREEFEDLKKSYEEQTKNIEETLIPIQEEITKSLERQKRHEDVYK